MDYSNALNSISVLDSGIHNPARLMIVYLLARKEGMDYLGLMKETQLSSGNITTHLNKLLDCGYIHITKTFKGRKPHTAVQLSEAGRKAYLNWGEHILAALPEETASSLPGRLTQSDINVVRYHLALRDWFPTAVDNQPNLPSSLKGTRSIAWPPLDGAWTF